MKKVLWRMMVVGTVCALLGASVQAEIRYTVTDLGTLGGNTSVAYSINNSGQIVGYAYDSANHQRAVLFDSSGHGNNKSLGTLGGTSSFARFINNLGQIVGWASTSSGYDRATRFDPTGSGNNTNLGTLGGSSSHVDCINGNGQAVGWAYPSSGVYRAALVDGSGGANNIALTPNWSEAYSINDSGQIVGVITVTADRATLFDSTGHANNVDLGTLGGSRSWAWSNNAGGQIVGGACLSSEVFKATVFDSSGHGNNLNLGALGGNYIYSSAGAINSNGQIVGWAKDAYGSAAHYQAVLFDPTGNGNNINLNSVIDPSLGWDLSSAASINDNGWIVGHGIINGQQHAFLLQPIPEPAVISLFSAGTLVLLGWKKP